MARFRSLSEVIQAQIQATVPTMSVPIGSPLAATFNSAPPITPNVIPAGKVLRWGFSTWGIEPVTDKSTPLD